MLKLVIFDHDGLMVNSEHVVFSALREIFAIYNHDYSWNYFTQHIGLSVEESLHIFYKDFPLPIPFEEFYSERNKRVEMYLAQKLELMPGLLPLLTILKRHGVSMAISTSGKKEYILKNLKKFDLTDFFSCVVSIDDVKQGKPHPDLVLKVLEILNVSPKDAMMLEDSPLGIEAANRAGVWSIAIPTSGMDLTKFSHAKRVFPDLYAAEVYINKLLTSSGGVKKNSRRPRGYTLTLKCRENRIPRNFE